jgi:hypothetical protein
MLDKSPRDQSRAERKAMRDQARPKPIKLADFKPAIAFRAFKIWGHLSPENWPLEATVEDDRRRVMFSSSVRVGERIYSVERLVGFKEIATARDAEGLMVHHLAVIAESIRAAIQNEDNRPCN